MNTSNCLVTYSACFINSEIEKELKNLRDSGYPVVVWTDSKFEVKVPEGIEHFPVDVSKTDFKVPAYPRGRLNEDAYSYVQRPLWTNGELANLLIKNKYPQYDYHIKIEADVRFSGKWRTLFKMLEKADDDFLAAYVRPEEWDRGYTWWNYGPPSYSDKWACFPPIFRISKPALDMLEEEYLKGEIGFCEVAMPTILKAKGFSVGDLAKCGNLYTRYSLYFVWHKSVEIRPNMPDKLWHPVKTTP